MQGQGFGGSPGPLRRRDRADHSKLQDSNLGHHTEGTWDPKKRRPSPDAGESTSRTDQSSCRDRGVLEVKYSAFARVKRLPIDIGRYCIGFNHGELNDC